MELSNATEVILHHETEWTRIMSEENDKQSLLRYAMTLLVIAYALMFVLTAVFSLALSAMVPFSAMHAVTSVVIEFALSVASLYFAPQILASIAPSFGGTNDSMSALKLYVFASTPAWIGMSIAMIPVLGWLVGLAGGIYAIYLFWSHFALAMSIPEDKKVGFVLVAVLVLAVIHIVIHTIGDGVANMVAPYSFHYGPNF
jgi:hypothetical protein